MSECDCDRRKHGVAARLIGNEFPEDVDHVFRGNADPFAAEIHVAVAVAPKVEGAFPSARVELDAHDDTRAVGELVVVVGVDVECVDQLVPPSEFRGGIIRAPDENFAVDDEVPEDHQIEVATGHALVESDVAAGAGLVLVPEAFDLSRGFGRGFALERETVRPDDVPLEVFEEACDDFVVDREIPAVLRQFQKIGFERLVDPAEVERPFDETRMLCGVEEGAPDSCGKRLMRRRAREFKREFHFQPPFRM